MTRIFYPIVDINDTIYYLDDDAIKEDKVTDIHITKDNIYYNTEAYILTFSDSNYNKTWFTNKIDCMEEML